MEFAAVAAYVKQAYDLASGFGKLKTEYEVNQKAIELMDMIHNVQSELFQLQSAHSAALSRIHDLENQLVRMENWEAERQRYHLHKLPAGGMVYRLKETVAEGEPVHDICPNCYQNGIKSVLQFGGKEKGYHVFSCAVCGNKVLGEAVRSMAAVVSYPEPHW